MNNVLRLTLNKKWFEMIWLLRKPEEYREIKPHWITRFCKSEYKKISPERLVEMYFDGVDIFHKEFDYVEFRNGYNKNSPTMLFECCGFRIDKGKTKWGAEQGKYYFVINLGIMIKSNGKFEKGKFVLHS